jgi:hypothetical protein
MTVRELVERLQEFPEDEPVFIPVGKANIEVCNVVLTYEGVALDYLE